MIALEENKGTHHLLMAWEECLFNKRELLRTQRVEDFNELRKLGDKGQGETKNRHSERQSLIVKQISACKMF